MRPSVPTSIDGSPRVGGGLASWRAGTVGALAALAVGAGSATVHAQATATPPFADHVMSVHRRAASSRLASLPRYDVALDVGASSVAIDETITVPPRWLASLDPTTTLPLRLFANGVTTRLTLEGASCAPVRCGATASGDVLTLAFDRALPSDAPLTITVRLTGRPEVIAEERLTLMGQAQEGMAALSGGEGAGEYGLFARGGGMLSLADAYAVLPRIEGRRASTDDLGHAGDRTTDALSDVRFVVRAPAGHVVVGTGLEREVTTSTGTVTVIDGAAVRETAVLVLDAPLRLEREVQGVRVRAFCAADHRAACDEVLSAAVAAVRTFTTRFGSGPYRELDVVEAPVVGGAGGVEFSGLVTIASSFMSSESLPGQDIGAMRRFITAHEVAHQWWHVLVGSHSRREPYVDESLAQYSAILATEAHEGRAAADTATESQVRMNYVMMRAMGIDDGAVARPASAFTASLAYAGLVYSKGALFYRALRRELGDAAFFARLRAYVSAHAFGEARGDELRAALAGGDASLEALVTRWWDEAHGDDDLGPIDPSALFGGLGGGLPDGLGALLRGDGGGGGALGGLGELLGVLGGLMGEGGGLSGALDGLGGTAAPAREGGIAAREGGIAAREGGTAAREGGTAPARPGGVRIEGEDPVERPSGEDDGVLRLGPAPARSRPRVRLE